MTFEEAKTYLSSLEGRGWRLGLDRMNELLHRANLFSTTLGESPKFIHVAGTNGKGTVTSFIQSILKEVGFRVGGYFSPYVYCLRERVQFDCELISKEEFAVHLSLLKPVIESFAGSDFDEVTEFEAKTALGFAYWKQKNCDWVACEVGMGGRLDATNVLTPKCSVITSIGLDHTQYLGETHAEIAAEKAGIIKHGVPVVVGRVPADSEHVIRKIAFENGSSCFILGKEFGPDSDHCIPGIEEWKFSSSDSVGIGGAYSVNNAWLASAAIRLAGIELDEQTWKNGLAAATLPGRMERRELERVEILLDGAHNAEAAEALVQSLSGMSKKWILVSNMLDGHDPKSFYEPLLRFVDSIHIAPIDFHRARNPDNMAEIVNCWFSEVQVHSDTDSALRAAVFQARETGRSVLVTGSFYLVGECGRLIEKMSGK